MVRLFPHVKTNKGFTLLELLIVIAIIGVLAGTVVVLVNPFTQLAKARDLERRNTLKQLQGALEQYYADNGEYPDGSYWYVSEPGQEQGAYLTTNGGNWIPGLAPKYIKQLPRDPSGEQCPVPGMEAYKRSYLYVSDGQQYALSSHCGSEVTPYDPNDALYDPARPSYAWKVCEGETACSSW